MVMRILEWLVESHNPLDHLERVNKGQPLGKQHERESLEHTVNMQLLGRETYSKH